MQRIPDQHLMTSVLKKSYTGLVIRVFDVLHTETNLISGSMKYPDGKQYGIDVAHFDVPRELSLQDSVKRTRKLGRARAVWLFENDNWNVGAMLQFVKDAQTGGLRLDEIYKGTSFGRQNNEIAFQARIIKAGFSGTGLQVHAPTVLAWTPEALLDYAQRVHLALKTLGNHQRRLSA